MTYNWCHGPKCHERNTTTRVRGVKGSKVLRTKKVPYSNHCAQYYRPYLYFCDQTCMHDFINKHYLEMVRMYPRTEALETPVEVSVETRTDYYDHPYKTTVIKKVDNSERVG